MKVVKTQIDELNAKLTLNVVNEDIAENVEKSIREYRRNAKVPGFRPGNVPVGLVKKMYGNAIIADELNKLVSKSISDYLIEEKLNLLGDPLPSETQEQIDFGKQDSYEFHFDIGLAPEFEVNLTKKDKVAKYTIKVDDEMVNKYVESYLQRFGQFVESDKSDVDSLLSSELSQIKDDGTADAIYIDDATLSIKVIKDEEIQKSFLNITAGQIVDFDIKKAFPNDTEIAKLLKIEKEVVASLNPNFRMTVKTVKTHKKAEMNQEFFDKCFGENAVNSEEGFRNRVIEDIRASFARETKYKLMLDIKEKLTKKLELKFPEAFLNRWIRATNKEITEEQIINEFPIFIEDLQWTLIKSKIAKDNELKVTEEEILEAAKQQMLAQFSQYGMSYIPDEYLTKYAQDMIKKEAEANKFYEQEMEEKVVDFVANAVKLDEHEVSIEEFQNMIKQ